MSEVDQDVQTVAARIVYDVLDHKEPGIVTVAPSDLRDRIARAIQAERNKRGAPDRDIDDAAADAWERIDGQDERPIPTIAAVLQAERDHWRRMSLEQWKLAETKRAESAETGAAQFTADLASTRRELDAAFIELGDVREAVEQLRGDLDCARRERDEVIARATKAEGKVAAAEAHMRTEMCRAMQSEKQVRELEAKLTRASGPVCLECSDKRSDMPAMHCADCGEVFDGEVCLDSACAVCAAEGARVDALVAATEPEVTP